MVSVIPPLGKKALNIFKNKFKSIFGKEQVTAEELQQAFDQMGDNGKMIIIAAIGATPGSALTLPLTIKIAKKMGINLLPTKTF